MKKGKEILTIAELKKAIGVGFYCNGKHREPRTTWILTLNEAKYNHALPDYKTLDQRLFDGQDSLITRATIDKSGYLRFFMVDSVWELPKNDGYEPNQELERDRTSDGYTLDEAKHFLKDGGLQGKCSKGNWCVLSEFSSDLSYLNLFDFRRKPQVKTFQNTPIGETYEYGKIKLKVVLYDGTCRGCHHYSNGCERTTCFKEKHISGKSVKAVKVEKQSTYSVNYNKIYGVV